MQLLGHLLVYSLIRRIGLGVSLNCAALSCRIYRPRGVAIAGAIADAIAGAIADVIADLVALD